MTWSTRPAPPLALRRLCLTTLSIACALATASCASNAQRSAPTADPPRLEPSPEALQTCKLYVLPPEIRPTQAEVEAAYQIRGLNLLDCDMRRALAVSTHQLEHQKEDAWKADREARRRPWWRFW